MGNLEDAIIELATCDYGHMNVETLILHYGKRISAGNTQLLVLEWVSRLTENAAENLKISTEGHTDGRPINKMSALVKSGSRKP